MKIYTGGGSNFSSHVADGSHTGARDAVYTRTMIFDDGSGASLYSQNSGNLKDDIFRTSPSLQFTYKKEITIQN